MFDVILQAGGLIAAGVLWRLATPLGLDADQMRANLTGLVYVLLLPALVLVVLWRAPLSLDAVRVGAVATLGIVTGFVAAWLWFRSGRLSRHALGAALLAAAFPNATYLGLPVLDASLRPWARSIAVQFHLFAFSPFLLFSRVFLSSLSCFTFCSFPLFLPLCPLPAFSSSFFRPLFFFFCFLIYGGSVGLFLPRFFF